MKVSCELMSLLLEFVAIMLPNLADFDKWWIHQVNSLVYRSCLYIPPFHNSIQTAFETTIWVIKVLLGVLAHMLLHFISQFKLPWIETTIWVIKVLLYYPFMTDFESFEFWILKVSFELAETSNDKFWKFWVSMLSCKLMFLNTGAC